MLANAALQLSVQDSTNDQASQPDMSKLLADQSFVSSILASVLCTRWTLSFFNIIILKNGTKIKSKQEKRNKLSRMIN